jgi:opacity protein-like surface antigen
MKLRAGIQHTSLPLTVILVAIGAAASAQTASTNGDAIGYVEFLGQSAWGNVTSQAYGAEGGIRITPSLEAVVEAGWARDVSDDATRRAAEAIAGFLDETQGPTAYSVTRSATYVAGGVRFPLASRLKNLKPYLEGSGGWAHLTRELSFSIAGTDVTGTLGNLRVQIGSDLAGSDNAGLMTMGGGVVWSVWRQVAFDFNYRYSRVFTSPVRVNLNRAGLGIGITF